MMMHVTNFEGVEFDAYQLKDIAYHWYEEWETMRGDNAESAVWDSFLSPF